VIALSRYVSLGSLRFGGAAATMLALVAFGVIEPVWLVFGISDHH
jgi:hypothetical protein